MRAAGRAREQQLVICLDTLGDGIDLLPTPTESHVNADQTVAQYIARERQCVGVAFNVGYRDPRLDLVRPDHPLAVCCCFSVCSGVAKLQRPAKYTCLGQN